MTAAWSDPDMVSEQQMREDQYERRSGASATKDIHAGQPRFNILVDSPGRFVEVASLSGGSPTE